MLREKGHHSQGTREAGGKDTLTLKANLRGFPFNSGRVRKQAGDTVWKKRVRKTKDMRVKPEGGFKGRKGRRQRGCPVGRGDGEEQGQKSLGKGCFKSTSFPSNILICRCISSPNLQNQGTPGMVVRTHDTTTPLHASACPPPLPCSSDKYRFRAVM